MRVGLLEQVVARNDGPAPITIHVGLASENIGTTADWPMTVVVPARGVLPLAYMAPVDEGAPYRYLFSYTYYVGRIDAPAASADGQPPFRDAGAPGARGDRQDLEADFRQGPQLFVRHVAPPMA